jgi:hypothetical protein
MPLLIDGHNLIGQMRDLSLSDPDDEAKLIRRLQAYALRTNKRITVVFDPGRSDDTSRLGSGKEQRGKLTVIYAPARSKADDVIRELVGETRDRQGLIVVTSDRAIASFTRQCGVRVQSSRSFIQQMNRDLAGTTGVVEKPNAGKAEVDAWADVFKEPVPSPKPVTPDMPRRSAAEMKRRKRAEQLKRQAKKRPLI